jgi:signal transduction histidine kinase
VEVRTQELVEERNKLDSTTKELSVARDEAVHANEAKSEFVSIVSHELKIPMTSIKGYTDLILSGMTGEVSEQQKEFLETIRNNVGRMSTLVSDLGDVSRIETGQLRLEQKKVDFCKVVEEVLEATEPQVKAKNQKLSTDEVPEELPDLYCDHTRLNQILTNLVSNANKYTPEGGKIEITARQLSAEGFNNMVQIAVKDSGYGISVEEQARLFQKFFRSDDMRAREAPGTGLGLNITKNLVELQGGEIWFESVLNEGTTFFFTLPINEEENE